MDPAPSCSASATQVKIGQRNGGVFCSACKLRHSDFISFKWLTVSWQRVALAITIVAFSLFFSYWDVQRITHRAWRRFGEILGTSSSFMDSWKPGARQIDDRWDLLWSNELQAHPEAMQQRNP